MTKNVLFEIGIEELPARFIDNAEKDLVKKTTDWLEELRIGYEEVTSFSTPRRLTILIHQIENEQKTIVEEVRGPAKNIAKDADGNWSKAAVGFTKGQGKSTEDIYTKDIKGTTYIFIEKTIEGKATTELLPTFKEIITSLQFPQSMRWGSLSFRFPRPIRWLLAIEEDTIIPFQIANIKTSNLTFGHRFLGEQVTLTDPLKYEALLKDNFVIADAQKREQLILDQISKLEEKAGFKVIVEEDLLNEVRNLVEFPTAFHGTFKEEYLKLPSEILITSMKEHQRYFPVKNEAGELLPYFIGVRNGDDNAMESIVRGNEKVLRARLADGEFFFTEDQRLSIDDYLEKLKTVVFQEKIGSLSDKADHIMTIAAELSDKLNLDEKVKAHVKRAAQICKFDLVTHMVDEFPELQGIMGEKYALSFGEKKEVAHAIREHYLPQQASGKLPESVIGSIISVADKLDTIVGSISIGLLPSGSQDPYGLRRQAIGVLRIIEDNNWNISVEQLISMAEKVYKIEDEVTLESIANFFKQRAIYILSERGIEQDVIQSVLHEEIGIFTYTLAKAKQLSDKRNDPSFKFIEESLVRIINLAKDETKGVINPELFETDSEQALYDHVERITPLFEEANATREAEGAINFLAELAEPIHEFFENNMVMDKNEAIKNNRLTLVHHIAELIYDYADLKLIEWKQHF